MIPQHLMTPLNNRLRDEVGMRSDVGDFLFTFAALEVNRDMEYAIEKLAESSDEDFKKAVLIVIGIINKGE